MRSGMEQGQRPGIPQTLRTTLCEDVRKVEFHVLKFVFCAIKNEYVVKNALILGVILTIIFCVGG